MSRQSHSRKTYIRSVAQTSEPWRVKADAVNNCAPGTDINLGCPGPSGSEAHHISRQSIHRLGSLN